MFAQWEEEEQALVRQLAESHPLESISVYHNGTLKRTYRYDFYKRYLGYDQFGPNGQIAQSRLLQHDENGFLIEETFVDEQSSENNTFYQYNYLEHWIQREECESYQIRDSITKKPTDKRNVRCFTYKTVLQEDNAPKEEYINFNAVFSLTKKYFYEGGNLVRPNITNTASRIQAGTRSMFRCWNTTLQAKKRISTYKPEKSKN